MLKAVQLLDVGVDNCTLLLAHEFVEEIRHLRGPVKVVAVCGKARQGKSTLLNMLVSAYGDECQPIFKVRSGLPPEAAQPLAKPCVHGHAGQKHTT